MARVTPGSYGAQWRARAIGEVFMAGPMGGEVPPASVAGMRFIRLTAGSAGAGGYNEGALTGETVSGSSPKVTATATISVAGSPLDGVTIHLINSERRFLRAGSTAGQLEECEIQSHDHSLTGVRNFSQVGYPGDLRYVGNSAVSNTGATGGSETRPRNIGAVAYMRVL